MKANALRSVLISVRANQSPNGFTTKSISVYPTQVHFEQIAYWPEISAPNSILNFYLSNETNHFLSFP